MDMDVHVHETITAPSYVYIEKFILNISLYEAEKKDISFKYFNLQFFLYLIILWIT